MWHRYEGIFKFIDRTKAEAVENVKGNQRKV